MFGDTFPEFKCSLWRTDDVLGPTRDISFQHPIKIYFGSLFFHLREYLTFFSMFLFLFYFSYIFMIVLILHGYKGAKFGGCQEIQKFRVYRDRFDKLLHNVYILLLVLSLSSHLHSFMSGFVSALRLFLYVLNYL